MEFSASAKPSLYHLSLQASRAIISVLVLDILNRQLLGFFIFKGIEVAGDLEIYGLHMGVNCLHQLPHIGGIFLVGSISLALNRRSNSRVWDLL